jgi:hypothetical protein
VASALKQWRRDRRDADYWKKARNRSASMREPEIVSYIDTSLMTMGQAISRYRQSAGYREGQFDQLYELRLHLEACLGMMDNLIPD